MPDLKGCSGVLSWQEQEEEKKKKKKKKQKRDGKEASRVKPEVRGKGMVLSSLKVTPNL